MGPVADLRVIELGDELSQYAGKLLADMGADVIKIESPSGSAARAVGPFTNDVRDVNGSLSFWYYNTNKHSVVLDLEGSDQDCDTFRKLIAIADVVIEACPPGRLAQLGLEYERLRTGGHCHAW